MQKQAAGDEFAAGMSCQGIRGNIARKLRLRDAQRKKERSDTSCDSFMSVMEVLAVEYMEATEVGEAVGASALATLAAGDG
jgi:hypothetical protein